MSWWQWLFVIWFALFLASAAWVTWQIFKHK